ncbi:AlwI family type II restriction endonuclease [Helicobacter bizzozeronii]|uniref:AlwI family type II restriction endonuclease n=1 Tax=Helicobacter bizzozeronii TaxID=56877 RepID=UPI001F29BCC6|nr:AlwI family type II restriction endonuclease [Helicobacter bizzozeronii]
MIAKKLNSPINLGDTSFRRKEIASDYKILLQGLQDLPLKWDIYNGSQELFYRYVLGSGLIKPPKEISSMQGKPNAKHIQTYGNVLTKIGFIDDKQALTPEGLIYLNNKIESESLESLLGLNVLESALIKPPEKDIAPAEQAKRARTYSNALVKIGFIDEKRALTPAGLAFLHNKIEPDFLENLLGLRADNLAFLRQLFKLGVYQGECALYIYRIALALLLRHPQILQDHFCKILLSLEPTQHAEQLTSIFDGYQRVVENKQDIDVFINALCTDSQEVHFANAPIKNTQFYTHFKNRKSKKVTALYGQFYQACLDFYHAKNPQNLKSLHAIGSDPAVIKAFGFGKPFFIESLISKENALFNAPNLQEFNHPFYQMYRHSKHHDLVQEYSDVLIRVFRVSGIISFSNGLVSLKQREVIQEIFSPENQVILETQSLPPRMATSLQQDLSLIEILNLDQNALESLEKRIRAKCQIAPQISTKDFLKNKDDRQFEAKLENRYTDSQLCALLKLFGDKKQHPKIQKEVTDNASVPTIFEYISAIVWHRISGKDFNLRDSMKLSLDADGLPLSHAPGGDGDIIARHATFDTMLEVTLMDQNAQKRGELEPVIRHGTNLSAQNDQHNRNSYVFFIADKLDVNVINLFRASAYIQLQHTRYKSSTQGVKIFALDTKQLGYLLEKKPDFKALIATIFKDYSYYNPKPIAHTWHKEVWQAVQALCAHENL